MALDAGDADGAVAAVERFFRRLAGEERLDRAPGLEMLSRAQARRGRPVEARAALDELREIVAAAPTEAMRAGLRVAEGSLALVGGETEAARAAFEDAVDLYGRCGGAWEGIRARLDLAATLAALGRPGEAQREIRAALAAASKVGAAREASRAAAMLESLTPRSAAKVADSGGRTFPGLTARESEVLALVASGLSNAAVAEKLCLSGHTVKRHVANILEKLNLPSRAAAAALYGRQSSG